MVCYIEKMLGAIIVLNEPFNSADVDIKKKQEIKVSMAAFQVFSGCCIVAGTIIIAASFSPAIFPFQQLITGILLLMFGDQLLQATETHLERNGIPKFA